MIVKKKKIPKIQSSMFPMLLTEREKWVSFACVYIKYLCKDK